MRSLLIILSLCVFWPAVALGDAPLQQSACIKAAAKAEKHHKIPDKLLQAITLVETGRGDGDNLVAWPWTTNVNSTGRYFDSRNDALQFIRNSIRNGESSIDVGCFQINTKWHGDKFAAIDDMVDPDAAADYAAKFLLGLKEEFGDWDIAASKYHSRTPAFGNRYARKLANVQQSLLDNSKSQTFAGDPFGKPLSLSGSSEFSGGVALSIFLDAKPLIESRAPRSLFQNAGSP